MENIYAVILGNAVPRGRRALPAGLLHELLREVTEVHRARKMVSRPYYVLQNGNFITITRNLEAVPWVLLDLRGRLYPMVLRIGVGMGTVRVGIRARLPGMKGPAFAFAERALAKVKRAQRKKNAPLTHFCGMNSDFNITVNELYRLNDYLARRMTPEQWRAFTARAQHNSAQETARALGVDAPTILRTLKRGYYGQMMAAASGIEQVIAERFYAVSTLDEKNSSQWQRPY